MSTTTSTPVYSLDDFVGQDAAKAELAIMIDSAQKRGDRLPHVLIHSGFAGVGKTMLAELIALVMGVGFHRIDPTAGPDAALDIIDRAKDRDLIFADEIHLGVLGGRNKLDWLLDPIEKGIILTKDEGAVDIKNVTFIAATTDVGKLPEALRSRFTEISLTRPTDTEAALISCNIAAGVLGFGYPLPKMGSCGAVAAAACNNPRRMRKLWEAVRDGYLYDADAHFHDDDYDVAPVLARKQLTPEGLDMLAVRYMLTLSKFSEGAGAKRIADALHEPSGVAATEALLLDKGFIMFVAKGRKLTRLGKAYVSDNLAEGVLA